MEILKPAIGQRKTNSDLGGVCLDVPFYRSCSSSVRVGRWGEGGSEIVCSQISAWETKNVKHAGFSLLREGHITQKTGSGCGWNHRSLVTFAVSCGWDHAKSSPDPYVELVNLSALSLWRRSRLLYKAFHTAMAYTLLFICRAELIITRKSFYPVVLCLK